MLDKVVPLIVPLATIVGLVVLLALGKIDQTAGVALIAGVAGVHIAGNAVTAGAKAGAQAALDAQPQATATATRSGRQS